MSVVIETTIGDLTVDLFTKERPIACLNFMKLCKLKYYNYNLFHNIERGFIAQTGDPTGVGDGGSSIWGVVEGQHKRFFEAEALPKIHHTTAGLLSLVGAEKHLVGSQFFFTLGENLSSLDGQHCVIGEVVEGHEVLRQLNEAIVDENFRPYQDIRITHTVILEDPFPDPRGFQEPSRSPSPSAERMKSGRIAADEDIDDTEGKSMEEIQEMLAEREAKARATILEIVGDLPDAEMAPPENVLFVCKLNPVTTDDDLEIIFSRFGKVKGCEVIRDRKTGDSLQYAFVEFEDQKSCEAAYFKMDNVLIDDRRIHVDFSQSVSKVKWRGKGRGIEGDRKGLDFNNLKDKDEKLKSREMYMRNKTSNSVAESRESRKERYVRQTQSPKRKRSTSRSKNRSEERNRRISSRNDFGKPEQRRSSRSPYPIGTKGKGKSHNNRSINRERAKDHHPGGYNHNTHNVGQKYTDDPDTGRYDRRKSLERKRRAKTHGRRERQTKSRHKKSSSDEPSSESDSSSESSETTISTESSSSSRKKRKKKSKKIKKNKSIKRKSKKKKR